ncbi:MAG: heme ABC exporter ATP-binding protein CcmA [Nitrospirae bacterium]|nr:heme ABC exporter ATP-binding protein CcmA [Nitrospirota bacterium]
MSISGDQLIKSYQHHQVLRGVSFEIREGSCYALFGPNGAGKSTLLRILATLIRPTSGNFKIQGFQGLSEKMKVREQIFLIGHGSYLYDDLTTEENVQFALEIRGISPSRLEIKTALDRVGIGPFAKLKSRFLSAGMKKRLSIARAILIRPKVLLLDEGYSSLDERGVETLNQCIRDFNREGMTILMTTHERIKTAEVAHQAGVLINGNLKEISVKSLLEEHAIF